MTAIEVSEPDIQRAFDALKRDAEAGGYHLNPDTGFVNSLVRGLVTNQRRYGYPACPCRLASGKKDDDLDICCPCDYRDPDLDDFGACYCALYVTSAVLSGQQILSSIPERRPARAERKAKQPVQPASANPLSALPYPVWRCKVCGYLCAREQPPGICPICKVTKERFERFI
ncbi:MAG: ferredoxin:glutaredoxin reductase [Methanoregula sp.]|nr:ferredoxin:glutaredoxin reductase [Methanoregula sp.]